jgi:hypothetical protein
MNKKMKFDGSDYPDPDWRGDASVASSGRRVNQCRREITDKFKGKISSTRQIELSTDRKTVTMTVSRLGQSRPKSVFVFDRASPLLQVWGRGPG